MSFFKKKNFLIAEAGINHNGDLKQALKLVSAAKKSGAEILNNIGIKTILTKNSISVFF